MVRGILKGKRTMEMNDELEPEPQCIDGEGHDFIAFKQAPDGTLFFKCRNCGEVSE